MKVIDGRARSGAPHAAVLVITTVLGLSAATTVAAMVAPPTVRSRWWVAALLSLAAVSWIVVAARRGWLLAAARTAPVTVVALLGLCAITLLLLFGSSWLAFIYGILGGLLVLVVTLVGMVVQAIRGRVDTLGALLALGLGAVLVANISGLVDARLRTQVHLAAPGLRAETEERLSRPAQAADPDGGAFRADAESGGSVVAWPMGRGLPASTFGLVADPQGVLQQGETVRSEGYPFLWSIDFCSHLEDEWYWCTFT